jgi:hypothetical protein
MKSNLRNLLWNLISRWLIYFEQISKLPFYSKQKKTLGSMVHRKDLGLYAPNATIYKEGP